MFLSTSFNLKEMSEHNYGEMTVNSSANSVVLIVFAFSDNLSAENSKLSADSGIHGIHFLGCMMLALKKKRKE